MISCQYRTAAFSYACRLWLWPQLIFVLLLVFRMLISARRFNSLRSNRPLWGGHSLKTRWRKTAKDLLAINHRLSRYKIQAVPWLHEITCPACHTQRQGGLWQLKFYSKFADYYCCSRWIIYEFSIILSSKSLIFPCFTLSWNVPSIAIVLHDIELMNISKQIVA